MNENRLYDLAPEAQPIYSVDKTGQRYCSIGNTRIKVTEHFSRSGKTITDLIGDMILADAQLNG